MDKDEHYTEQEVQRGTEAALRAAFKTPYKTYEQSKLGKPRGKTKETKRAKRRRGA